jgi:hypothetical protein
MLRRQTSRAVRRLGSAALSPRFSYVVAQPSCRRDVSNILRDASISYKQALLLLSGLLHAGRSNNCNELFVSTTRKPNA